MFGSLGLPELIVLLIIGVIGLPIPAAIFGLGYYFGRRSARRDTNVTPTDAASGPPHV
jgi:hypothetical protein